MYDVNKYNNQADQEYFIYMILSGSKLMTFNVCTCTHYFSPKEKGTYNCFIWGIVY
jgi:predicted nucleic acid-binding Zn finger protein